MKIRVASLFFAALLVWAAGDLAGQSFSASSWNLPHGTAVKDNGPRTYRFILEYNTANTKGEVIYRQRVEGEYKRGLPNGEVAWSNVTVADAAGPDAPFQPAQKRDFMEGFRYRNDIDSTLKPDFFKGFPPTAIAERNLVWDTGMIEKYGQNYFDRLKLNEPYRSTSNDDVAMPGVGTFHSRNVALQWIGHSQRNGQDCALITYQSFFNSLEIANGGMTMQGRSDYWGEIWVSLATKQIEYATLYEVVVADMKLPGQDATQVVNVFRSGTFEPVSAK
jgi:hypothetical protein